MPPRTISIQLFDHATDLEHKDVDIKGYTAEHTVSKLADVAQTVQELGQAIVLWYDVDVQVLRVKAVPQNLGA